MLECFPLCTAVFAWFQSSDMKKRAICLVTAGKIVTVIQFCASPPGRRRVHGRLEILKGALDDAFELFFVSCGCASCEVSI